MDISEGSFFKTVNLSASLDEQETEITNNLGTITSSGIADPSSLIDLNVLTKGLCRFVTSNQWIKIIIR
jgi:hypothetical protein